MLDSHVLADRVSLLLKTRYAETPLTERPFDLAFTEVMDNAGVVGTARGTVKSEIGKILRSRPRKAGKKTRKPLVGQQAQFSFGIAKADRKEVILTSPTGGQQMVFRRDHEGKVVSTAFTGACTTMALIMRAKELAETLFTAKDREAIEYDRLRVTVRDDNHIEAVLANKYEAYISRGLRSGAVATTVTCDGKTVIQKIVPSDLLREAKAIARQHFKGVGTMPLPFS